MMGQHYGFFQIFNIKIVHRSFGGNCRFGNLVGQTIYKRFKTIQSDVRHSVCKQVFHSQFSKISLYIGGGTVSEKLRHTITKTGLNFQYQGLNL